jgi:hypothetical protein
MSRARPSVRLWRIVGAATGLAVAGLGLVIGYGYYHVPAPPRIFLPFPPDRQCAIAITDDTDFFQLETTGPVYALLDSLGLRVTKTTWVFDAPGRSPRQTGLSLADGRYRSWLLGEIPRGHEITLHSPSAGDDTRQRILAAYDTLATVLGHRPRLDIFHSTNREAFYWGAARFPSSILRVLLRRLVHGGFAGHDPSSPYYWLDISRSLVRYIRTYTFNDVNTLRINPSMPYLDSRTPDAPFWFASSNGRTEREFVTLLSPGNVARLKAQHGACVVYTHLGVGFSRPGPGPGPGRVVAPEVGALLRRVGEDPGVEFVPAGELLDRLRVVQLLEDAVHAGRSVVRIPDELVPAMGKISVAADAISSAPAASTSYPTTRSDRPGDVGKATRVPLETWMAAHQIGWERGGTVFDSPRMVGAAERWRLVLRWMFTQFGSPT